MFFLCVCEKDHQPETTAFNLHSVYIGDLHSLRKCVICDYSGMCVCVHVYVIPVLLGKRELPAFNDQHEILSISET